MSSKELDNNPFGTKNLENNNRYKIKENGISIMIYKLDKKLYEHNKYLRLFGENFIKKNKSKCSIIIAKKEYDIISIIDEDEFDKYGINKEDETLTVIFKGKTIEDMSYMFAGCETLIKVDFSSFNTQNVTDMKDMFSGCLNLIKIDLSSFNTQNVIDMRCMFNFCQNIIKIDLSSFNTQNVTDMRCMFNFCRSLIKIDLSSFNIKNVTNVNRILIGCETIIKIKRKNINKIKNVFGLKESELSIIEI